MATGREVLVALTGRQTGARCDLGDGGIVRGGILPEEGVWEAAGGEEQQDIKGGLEQGWCAESGFGVVFP